MIERPLQHFVRWLGFFLRQLTLSRVLLLLLAYAVIFIFSFWLAFQLRFDFEVPAMMNALFIDSVIWAVPLKLALMFAMGQFGGLLSYFRLPDLNRIFAALTMFSTFLVFLWYASDPIKCPPRSIILGDFVFSLLILVFFRMTLRVLRERYLTSDGEMPLKSQRVAIVGAGDVGTQVAADMMARRGLGLRPVLFLDDDRQKWRKHVHGIPVLDSPDNLPHAKAKYALDAVVIAMPSAPARRIQEIVRLAALCGLRAEIVPSLTDLATGKVRASQVRPVDIEDLLGRDPVELNCSAISEMIADQVVMVTGAGGSIGMELSRQIALRNPKRLILIEQSEFALFGLESRLQEDGIGGVALPLIADILDEGRMRFILNQYRPSIVFHAAAHKHVPIMERQPAEAIKNNSFGTALLARLAGEFGVARFVLISTDKAINPTSVMGASKRLAEIFIQAQQGSPGTGTRYMAVRFGNVLGSSGSVIPIFRQQIADGGPVRVTHPEITRYFMTIPEAVGLVLQCATQGQGGEIFVLNMGTPVKIVDLARQMIELSGYRPGIDIEIVFTGLRPGEKLFEELRHIDEHHSETSHPQILRFLCQPPARESVAAFFQQLREELDTRDRNQIKLMLKTLIPEYSPFLD